MVGGAPSVARTIAVLSAGEMGSQVGRVLREDGVRVVTCLAGRGPATARRAAEAGLEPLPDLAAVVAAADLVVAVVPSRAAVPLVEAVAAAMRRAGRAPLYVDANSIAPPTAEVVAHALAAAGGTLVDGAIIGGADGLRRRTTLYLSGERADEAAALLAPLATLVLGPRVGQASGFKVLYAGLTKGLSALGVELLAGADGLGLRAALLERYRADHEGVVRFWERTLPGLPPRAARRAQEMEELVATLEGLALPSHLARAAGATLAEVAARAAVAPVEDSASASGSERGVDVPPTSAREGAG